MHNLCVFCTFSTFVQKIFKGWGWNFTRSFGKVIRSKSMKMVFVTSIIRNELCIIYAFFHYFFQKSFFTKNYFLIAAIYLTTWGPWYTCLVQRVLSITKIDVFKMILNLSWCALQCFYISRIRSCNYHGIGQNMGYFEC